VPPYIDSLPFPSPLIMSPPWIMKPGIIRWNGVPL
jgi:hypothetical protein